MEEKNEKYAWHDIVADPHDEPEIGVSCIGRWYCLELDEYCLGTTVRMENGWNSSIANKKVCIGDVSESVRLVAWKYIEPIKIKECSEHPAIAIAEGELREKLKALVTAAEELVNYCRCVADEREVLVDE